MGKLQITRQTYSNTQYSNSTNVSNDITDVTLMKKAENAGGFGFKNV